MRAMKKYSYKDSRTGRTVQSNTPLEGKHLVLQTQVKNGMMDSGEVKTKTRTEKKKQAE